MKPGRCLLGENCGYITSDSLLPLSLCMSLPVDGVFAASQAYWKMARELKRTRFFFGGGVGSAYDEALCFLDVFAVVETSSLTATLCLIWRDSYVEAVTVEKSRCLCNTSVLSDEINSTVKVSCWQAADGQEKTRKYPRRLWNVPIDVKDCRDESTDSSKRSIRCDTERGQVWSDHLYEQSAKSSLCLSMRHSVFRHKIDVRTDFNNCSVGTRWWWFYRRLHKKTLSYK